MEFMCLQLHLELHRFEVILLCDKWVVVFISCLQYAGGNSDMHLLTEHLNLTIFNYLL